MAKFRFLNHKRMVKIEGNLLVEYPKKSRGSKSQIYITFITGL